MEGADIRGGARGEWREAMERGEGSEKGEDSCAHQVGRAAVSAVEHRCRAEGKDSAEERGEEGGRGGQEARREQDSARNTWELLQRGLRC